MAGKHVRELMETEVNDNSALQCTFMMVGPSHGWQICQR